MRAARFSRYSFDNVTAPFGALREPRPGRRLGAALAVDRRGCRRHEAFDCGRVTLGLDVSVAGFAPLGKLLVIEFLPLHDCDSPAVDFDYPDGLSHPLRSFRD